MSPPASGGEEFNTPAGLPGPPLNAPHTTHDYVHG